MAAVADRDRLVRTTVHVSVAAMEAVRAIAQRRGVTVAAIIRIAINNATDDYRPPPGGGFL